MGAPSRKTFCAVCKKQSRHNLFKFPADSELRDLWASATQVQPLSKKDNSTRICHIHFDSTSWDQRVNTDGKVINILKSDAVPTLYVGKDAPPIDPQCSIPAIPYEDYVRCCICCKKTDINGAIAVFNQDDFYTEFGAALSIILRKSRVLMSRYSCRKCSAEVIDCFKKTVEITVSTMLTTRLLTKQNVAMNNSLSDSDDESLDDMPLNKFEERLRRENMPLLDEDFSETCEKCGKVASTLNKFTEHYVEHLLSENQEVYRLHAVSSHVDEMDVEMGVLDHRENVYISKEDDKPPPNLEEDGTKRKKGKLKTIRRKSEKTENDIKKVDVEPELEHTGDFDDDCGFNDDNMDEDDDDDEDDFNIPPRESKDVMVKGHVSRKRLTKGEKMRAHEPRMCHLCGIKLKNRRSYLSHLLRHKNPEKFNKTCHLCGKRRVNIAQHIRLCRREMEKNPDGPKERKLPTANCHVCGKKVSGIYLPQHLKRHEMAADIAANGAEALEKYLETCEICGKKVRNLYIHRYHHKRNKEMPDEPDKKIRTNYDCDHCGARFMQRALLVNHLVLKHGMDPRELTQRGNRGMKTVWTCSICKQTFLTYNAIRRHTKQEHNGIGLDLSCETCGKKYNCVAALRFHINTQHLNYFKARCKKCGNYFAEEASLKEHIASRCRAVYGPKRTRSSSARRQQRAAQTEEVVHGFDDSKFTHLSAGSTEVMMDYNQDKMAPALLDLQMLHGVRIVQEAKLYQQQQYEKMQQCNLKMMPDPKMMPHHSKMIHPQPPTMYAEHEHPLYHIPHL